MKHINDNQKVSLKLSQIRHLVNEAHPTKTMRQPTARNESTEIDIYPEVTDTQSKCPDLNPNYYPHFVGGAESYIILLDAFTESGLLWGPFDTIKEAEIALFDMAAAFRADNRLVTYSQSALIFRDKYDGEETYMYIVTGSLDGRLDTV